MAYLYLAPYTNITKPTRSRNSTSVPNLSPVYFAIIVSTRFSTYFTLPVFQPWANVVSSVSSHFKIRRLYLIEISFRNVSHFSLTHMGKGAFWDRGLSARRRDLRAGGCPRTPVPEPPFPMCVRCLLVVATHD